LHALFRYAVIGFMQGHCSLEQQPQSYNSNRRQVNARLFVAFAPLLGAFGIEN
jgi:hypothetical protein